MALGARVAGGRVTPRLSVVITCLDEGAEVERTLASLRATAGDAVVVVLVNDGSSDGFDYRGAAERAGARYVENPVRRGTARARDIGVAQVRTPHAMLVDAHMRFHDDGWWRTLSEAIEDDPRAIYCTRCEALDEHGARRADLDGHAAARIRFEGTRFDEILEPKWLARPALEAACVDVPCVLGATYGFHLDYYRRLGGLLGLRAWGGDEVYLSLKAWLEGGRCRLLTGAEIGHVFAPTGRLTLHWLHLYYNKLFLAETLLPRELALRIRAQLEGSADDPAAFGRAAARIEAHRDMLVRLRAHYAALFQRPFDEVLALSEACA